MTDYADWRDAFASAMDPRFYTIEHLDRMIEDHSAVLVAGREAAVVVELKTFPTGLKAIHFIVAAGDLAEIKDDLRVQVENAARESGCAMALIESREGWARALKSEGYELFQLSIVKEL